MDDHEFYEAVAGLVNQIEMADFRDQHGMHLKNNSLYRHVKLLADATGRTAEGQKRLAAQFEQGDSK